MNDSTKIAGLMICAMIALLVYMAAYWVSDSHIHAALTMFVVCSVLGGMIAKRIKG